MFESLPPELVFPKGFLWGASTAAYQIEGDNRGSDLWDWERRMGWEPSGLCADSWERWEEDVALLADLGADAYRFSVEWGRVLPEPGRPDREALARYRRLVEALRSRGIRPVLTLHHFTHPAWFWRKHRRGWREEGSTETFMEFVRLAAEAFGGLVEDWIPFNEPNVVLLQQHVTGYFPPGRRSLLRLELHPLELRQATVGLARAHRAAYAYLKERVPGARVGVAQNIAWVEPLTESPRDRAAALQWDQAFHWNLLDGMADGRMDLDLDGRAETSLGEGRALDFVGVNYYTRVFVRHAPWRGPLKALPLYGELGCHSRLADWAVQLLGGWRIEQPKDDMGREIFPEGLERVLLAAHARYKLPLLVTENGIADDANRMREVYLLGHLMRLRKALDRVPVLGYLYWSLLDNYEWGSFKPRFGLYRVDYADGRSRTLTRGGALYRELIRRSRAA